MKKHRIGISVYPDHQDIDVLKKYIETAAKHGYERVFTSLLQVTKKDKDEVISKFKAVFEVTNKYNMEVILDVAPNIFGPLDINLPDTSFFEDLGIQTIRFDESAGGAIEAAITREGKFKVEVNMSTEKKNGIDLLKNNAILNNVIGSHNFYPQKYTALGMDYFKEMSKFYKDIGIRTSAFITAKDGVGPWIECHRLPTLEGHRYLSIKEQAKDLLDSNLIDDIIIGNSPATEEELIELTEFINNYVDTDKLEIDLEVIKEISPIEEEITFKYDNHFRRSDITPYFIRSTFSREYYKDSAIAPRVNEGSPQLPGEVYILNDNAGRYKGELHIISKEMPYDEIKNLIGKVRDRNQIKSILGNEKFTFKQ